jgi:hypothetical protein
LEGGAILLLDIGASAAAGDGNMVVAGVKPVLLGQARVTGKADS